MTFPCEPSVLSALLTAPSADTPMIVDADGSVMTRREFLAAVKGWHHRFQRLAEKPHLSDRLPRVVVFSEDCGDFLTLVFGAWSAGVMTVLAGDVEPATFARLVEAGVLREGDACALEAAQRLADDEAARLGLLKLDKPDDDDRCEEPCVFAPLSDSAPLAAMLTSGSTGVPKLVVKPLGELFYEAQSLTQAFSDLGISFSADAPAVVLGTVTQQHIYGILFRALMPLTAPGLLCDAPRVHFPKAIAARLRMHAEAGRRVIVVSSPAHLSRLADPALFDAGRRAVAACASSGGPLDEAGALRCFKAFGCFPLEVLGSTETGGMARRVRRLAEGSAAKVDTPNWRPMPGVSITALPEAGAAAAPSLTGTEVGRIAIAANHLAQTSPLAGDDLIERFTDGSFRLLGRADRVVKIEGKRASLPEIESLLMSIEGVAAAKCFVKPQPQNAAPGRSALLCAVLVPSPELKARLFALGKNAVLTAIRTALAQTLPTVLFPKRWRFVDRLPTNAAGKTTLAHLELLFSSDRPEWLLESDGFNSRGERQISLRMRLMPNLDWFKGHFPALPILPGVAQLLLAQRGLLWAAELAGIEGRFTHAVGVKNLKFKSITRPGMTVRLTLSLPAVSPDSAERCVRFEWAHLEADRVLSLQSQGTIVFAIQ